MGCNCGGGRAIQAPVRAQSSGSYQPNPSTGQGNGGGSPGYAQQSNPNRAVPASLPSGVVISPRTVI